MTTATNGHPTSAPIPRPAEQEAPEPVELSRTLYWEIKTADGMTESWEVSDEELIAECRRRGLFNRGGIAYDPRFDDLRAASDEQLSSACGARGLSIICEVEKRRVSLDTERPPPTETVHGQMVRYAREAFRTWHAISDGEGDAWEQLPERTRHQWIGVADRLESLMLADLQRTERPPPTETDNARPLGVAGHAVALFVENICNELPRKVVQECFDNAHGRAQMETVCLDSYSLAVATQLVSSGDT